MCIQILSTLSNNLLLHEPDQENILSVQPLVTIVIPTYNRSLLIQDTIASVLAQTYSNWELIIVDDGSTDSTVDMIRSIKDKRVRIMGFPHCGNIAMLRNIGVKSGLGQWIAFLDSDDTWVPQKLELQLAALQKDTKQWCYGGFELMNETGTAIPSKSGTYHPFSGWILPKVITYEASVTICSIMLRRSLFDEIGGFNSDAGLFCREDYEFVLRLAMHAEALALASVLVCVRDHPGRTTNTFTNGPERTANVYGFFYRCCNDNNIKKLVHRQYAHHLADTAEKNLYKKNYLRAIKYFAKAIANGDKPRHLLSSFKHGFIKHNPL
jgi:glycosyltransferase involved in cell wall biosynthesis